MLFVKGRWWNPYVVSAWLYDADRCRVMDPQTVWSQGRGCTVAQRIESAG